MTNEELQRLIREWYQQGLSDTEEVQLTAREACPPLALLWRHVAENWPLGEYGDHVADCDRCSRLTAIIEKERSRLETVPADGGAARWRTLGRVGGLLALAACVALVVVNWPRPSLDSQVAVFCETIECWPPAQTFRGLGAPQPSADDTNQPAWLRSLLDDDEASEAIDGLYRLTPRLLQAINATPPQILVDEEGGLSIGPDLDKDDARRPRLERLINDSEQFTNGIVDALLLHWPGVSEEDRAGLRKALSVWRATNIFGEK